MLSVYSSSTKYLEELQFNIICFLSHLKPTPTLSSTGNMFTLLLTAPLDPATEERSTKSLSSLSQAHFMLMGSSHLYRLTKLYGQVAQVRLSFCIMNTQDYSQL